jgi:ferredoxin
MDSKLSRLTGPKVASHRRVDRRFPAHATGVVVVLDENSPADQADNARKAEAACPALAIHIEE